MVEVVELFPGISGNEPALCYLFKPMSIPVDQLLMSVIEVKPSEIVKIYWPIQRSDLARGRAGYFANQGFCKPFERSLGKVLVADRKFLLGENRPVGSDEGRGER